MRANASCVVRVDRISIANASVNLQRDKRNARSYGSGSGSGSGSGGASTRPVSKSVCHCTSRSSRITMRILRYLCGSGNIGDIFEKPSKMRILRAIHRDTSLYMSSKR